MKNSEKNIFEEIVRLVFSNKQLPYYSAERRLDPIFNVFLEDILSAYYGTPVAYVASEFPLKLEDNNQSNELDYLCRIKKGNTVLFVELKTDNNSYSTRQLDFYRRNNDWEKVTKQFLEKASNKHVKSDDRIKYYNLVMRLLSENLVAADRPDLIRRIDAMRNAAGIKTKLERTTVIREFIKSIKPIALEVRLVYIGPENNRFKKLLKEKQVDFISFSMLKAMKIRTSYKTEWRYFLQCLNANLDP